MSAKIRLFLILPVLMAGLAACAGHAPVPSGDDTVNEKFYKSEEELIQASARLLPGMTEREVFGILRRNKDDMVRMSRDEIVSTLYGGNNAAFDGSLEQREQARGFVETLYGYKMEYKIVRRKMGFSSPIRLRTDEKGIDYTLKLVFWQGRLFDRPVLYGGPVRKSSSDTLFDYLNPFSWVLSR